MSYPSGTIDMMDQEELVLTEAEKDSLKRKRMTSQSPPSPPPPSQQDYEPLDVQCEECGHYILPEDEGECAFCIQAMLARMKDAAESQYGPARPGEGENSGADDHYHDEEEGEEAPSESGLPDLHEYFMQFPAISDENVISMCRAYASYLASLSKKKIFKKPDGCLSLKRRRTRQTK